MSTIDSTHVVAECVRTVLVLTIDRPQSRNALNPSIVSAIAAHLIEADLDPGINAAVLTGGADNFSAGADNDVLFGHWPASYLASPTRRAFESIRRTGPFHEALAFDLWFERSAGEAHR